MSIGTSYALTMSPVPSTEYTNKRKKKFKSELVFYQLNLDTQKYKLRNIFICLLFKFT